MRRPLYSRWLAAALLLALSPAAPGQDASPRRTAEPRDDPKAFIARGDDHAESGDLKQAVADYTEAILLDANEAHAHVRRASAWLKLHERQRAIDDYSAAIRIEPANPSHYLGRGTAWSRLGEHAPAIADLDEAIRLNPNDPAAYIARATEWERHLQPDPALADYQAAIALDPGAQPAYEGRGRIWARRGEFDRVVANYAELARRAPENPIGHRELAWLLATCDTDALRDGRRALAEATIACEQTKWAEPRCIEALAAAYAECGDFDAALKWQSHAIKIFTASNTRVDRRIKYRQDAAMGLRLYRYKKRQPHHERPDRAV